MEIIVENVEVCPSRFFAFAPERKSRACPETLFRNEIAAGRASRGRTMKAYMRNIRRGGRTMAQPACRNCSRKEGFWTCSRSVAPSSRGSKQKRAKTRFCFDLVSRFFRLRFSRDSRGHPSPPLFLRRESPEIQCPFL